MDKFPLKVTYNAYKPVEGEGSSGIMSSIVEGRDLVMFPSSITLFKITPPCLIQSTNWLEKTKVNILQPFNTTKQLFISVTLQNIFNLIFNKNYALVFTIIGYMLHWG